MFAILGTASILYFIIYALCAGLNNIFTYFWLLLGIFLIAWQFKLKELWKQVPKILRRIVLVIFVAGALVLSFVEVQIIRYSAKAPVSHADYVMVLGAQVYGTKASYALSQRLKSAYQYLEENPDTKVIVTGGKGLGEDITEAECERNWLLAKGIDESRILVENTSRSTDDNFKNSKQYLQSDDSIVVVTNSFHVYRSIMIAKKQGYTNISGIGAKIKAYTAPNLYLREGIAVIKYYVFGQI